MRKRPACLWIFHTRADPRTPRRLRTARSPLVKRLRSASRSNSSRRCFTSCKSHISCILRSLFLDRSSSRLSVHKGAPRRGGAKLRHVCVYPLAAVVAGYRDPVMAIQDEIAARDLVEVYWRQLLVLARGPIYALPPLSSARLGGHEASVELGTSADAADYPTNRHRPHAPANSPYRSGGFPGLVKADDPEPCLFANGHGCAGVAPSGVRCRSLSPPAPRGSCSRPSANPFFLRTPTPERGVGSVSFPYCSACAIRKRIRRVARASCQAARQASARLEREDLGSASRAVVHPARQRAHLGVAALAGMGAQGVGEAGHLLQGLEHGAEQRQIAGAAPRQTPGAKRTSRPDSQNGQTT